jgi:hypothetical protein
MLSPLGMAGTGMVPSPTLIPAFPPREAPAAPQVAKVSAHVRRFISPDVYIHANPNFHPHPATPPVHPIHLVAVRAVTRPRERECAAAQGSRQQLAPPSVQDSRSRGVEGPPQTSIIRLHRPRRFCHPRAPASSNSQARRPWYPLSKCNLVAIDWLLAH